MKILYIASHLSTGGMPELLKVRVESLLLSGIDVWVVEYSQYSDYYINHRNSIKSMIGDRFISLGWFSDNTDVLTDKFNKLRDLIITEKFDVIHLDDPFETYDVFNGVLKELAEFIYNLTDKKWKVVETLHNSFFDLTTQKVYIPDGFMYCSDYHMSDKFNEFNKHIYADVVEYPIYERTYNTEKPIEFVDDVFNILNVGIWTPGKNQKEAIELARCMDTYYPNKYLFHFMGALAPNFQSYWQPILDDLPNNVKIWDVQYDMGKFYEWADLVLFNSTNELNPIVLKEAVSYKKKLLIRNLPIYGDMYNKYADFLTGIIQVDSLKLHRMCNISNNIEYEFTELKHMGLDMIKFYENIQNVSQNIKESVSNKSAPVKIITNFHNGPFVELTGENDGNEYYIEFIDRNTNTAQYSTKLFPNHWAKSSLEYYKDWKIRITPLNEHYESVDVDMNLYGKSVLIKFDSAALGDTLAWIPYVDKFREKHSCIVYCSTFHNHLFIDKYPKINFIQPDTNISNLYTTYELGWFYNGNSFVGNKHPNHFVDQPLQKTATDILGLDYTEITPIINTYEYTGELPTRYFSFSLQSTAQSKYWNYSNGWYDLLELLKADGIVGVCVDKYPSFGSTEIMNIIPTNAVDKTGLSIEDTIGIISNAQFHIGISSGLSWLAWALNKKVVMISGFTHPTLEFTKNCIRIFNDTVCNGCFTNASYEFDRGDWSWCPVHKGTDRQFECTRSITPIEVFTKIKEANLI
jgi:autotransporter strand-loop-strand O-heptosyltransferase